MVPSGRRVWPTAWRALARDERGVVAILTALLIVPVTLALGIAVDASRLYLVRSRLSEALDSAALAAAQVTDEATLRADAQRLFDANFPAGYMGSILRPLQVAYDATAGRVELRAQAAVPTVVMQLAHIDSVDVDARAVAIRRRNAMEVALVLDVTGSMAGSKIQTLKQAVRDLLDILLGPHDTADELWLAVVPFSARVNVGNTHRDWIVGGHTGQWTGCVESRSGSLALSDAPPGAGLFRRSDNITVTGWHLEHGRWTYGQYETTPPCPLRLLPLTQSKSIIRNRVDGLTPEGSTRIDMGARWGWRVLSPRWRGLWDTHGRPRERADDLTKAMVLMTDGQNEVSTYDEVSAAQANANLLQICTSMKAEGILIYTIGFQAPAATRPLLQACASGPGFFFESPTEEALRRAFRQIAGRLSALRLAE